MSNNSPKVKPTGHHSIKGNIIGVIVFFILTLLFFLDIPISALTGKITPINSSEIISTYDADSGDFIYNGKAYSLVIYIQPECNEQGCPKVNINNSVIVLDERSPMRSRLGSELGLMLVFPIIMIVNIIVGYIRYFLNIRRKKKIQEYLSSGTSIETIVVDIIGHYRKKQRTRYTYICQNPQTGETHESESYYDKSVPIGSLVRVYTLSERYPGTKYIDMENTLPPNEVSLAITEKYKEIKSAELRESFKLFWKGEKAQLYQKIAIAIITIFIAFLSLVALSSDPKTLFLFLPFYGIILYLGYIIIKVQEKKNIIKNGVPHTGIIKSIHKHGLLKSIPFGYIPEGESSPTNYIPIDPITKRNKSISNIPYGYVYSFTVYMEGIEYTSEKFGIPFPEKAKVGGKIHIYFKDLSMQKYVIDEESIDTLN